MIGNTVILPRPFIPNDDDLRKEVISADIFLLASSTKVRKELALSTSPPNVCKHPCPNLSHKSFEADLAFGPEIENEEVYQRAVVASDVCLFSKLDVRARLSVMRRFFLSPLVVVLAAFSHMDRLAQARLGRWKAAHIR